MKRTFAGLALSFALIATLTTAALAGEMSRVRELLESDKYAEAIPILQKYVERFPNEPRAWSLLARCYENVFPPLVDEAGRAHERKSKAENRRATIFSAFKSVESSSTYQKLVSDEPQDVYNNLLLAIAFIVNDHDLDPAKKQLEKVTRLGVPEDVRDAYYNTWGLYYIETKEWENARKAFQNAKRFSTNTYALAKLQEIDRLEADYRKQQDQLDDDPSKVNDKRFGQLMEGARGMMTEGNNEGAVDLLEEAIKLKVTPESRTMLEEAKRVASLDLYNAGKLLVDNLQHAEAYDKFEKAMRLDPGNASASLGLEHVRKHLADLDQPRIIRRFITGTPPPAGASESITLP